MWVSISDVADVFAGAAADFVATFLSAFGESPGWVRVVVLSQVYILHYIYNIYTYSVVVYWTQSC